MWIGRVRAPSIRERIFCHVQQTHTKRRFVPRDMLTGSAEAAGAVPMLKPRSVILAF
jgi:hypothetical protein